MIDEEQDENNKGEIMTNEDRYYKYTHLKDSLREFLPQDVQLNFNEEKL